MKYFFLLCTIICTLSLELKSQILYEQISYAVAHNNGNANVLFQFNAATNQWAEIGLTGTNNIKAIATDPINKIIYAVDGGTFGTINPQTGLFTAIGIIGSANGDNGLVDLNDIEGLTYDYVNKIMYATHRVNSGTLCNPIEISNDLLFQINPFTGQFVPNAMLDASGRPADYGVIEIILPGTDPIPTCSNIYWPMAYDVNDIAYNVYTGELYAIQNEGKYGEISIIDPVSAEVETLIFDFEDMDFVGLAFSSLGELFSTTGVNAANGFKYINLQNQDDVNLPFPDASGTNVDFRGLDFLGAYNDLALEIKQAGFAAPFTPGDELTFLIKLSNQGEITNTNILISNYIPNGLILNDEDWELIPGTNTATYIYEGQLKKNKVYTKRITFTVEADFTGDKIVNSAEITASYGENITDPYGNPLPLPDIDSWPDDYNNEIFSEDEDDHDSITVLSYDFANAQTSSFPCYTVNEDGGNDPNNLFEFDPLTQKWTIIGEIDPIGDLIEAIATDPINDIIYAYDAGKDVLGIIDPNAANNRTLFIAIGTEGEGVGTANGDYGAVKLDDVDGLTFDPVNMILYGSHRINSGDICNPRPNTNDLLFQIDVSTGKFVPGAMLNSTGNPADYAIIEEVEEETLQNDYTICPNGVVGGGYVYDVDDIAYNPYTGELYAIQNQDDPSTITSINPLNGHLETVIFDVRAYGIEGLGFGYLGNLFATKDDNGSTADQNKFTFFDIDTKTETDLAYPDPTGTFVDFEAFDCFSAFNDLAHSYTVAPGNPTYFNAGVKVTFQSNIYNQGDFTNTNITLTNYIPDGLTLADNDWTLNPNGKATYTIIEALELGDLISIPITFIINEGFEGQTITGFAEISSSFGVDLIDVQGQIFTAPLPDVDSTPDDDNNEFIDGAPLNNNDIKSGGPNANEDEDDHDFASIEIPQPLEGLSLTKSITPAFCNRLGAAEIKISADSTPPYTHKWIGPLGSQVHLETTYSLVNEVNDLPVGIYYVIVTDASDRINSSVVTIPMLANDSGNLACDNDCPKYLSTSSNSLYGNFQAEKKIEINGYVEGSQDAEFSICE